MKINKIFILTLTAFATVISSCGDKNDIVSSTPVIGSVSVQSDNALLSDSIRFDATVSDPERPLSTLEISLNVGGKEISHKSIRTKGKQVNLKDEAIAVPFVSDVNTGDDMTLNFTLINIDGNEVTETRTVKAKRPDLPSSLYLIKSDKSVIELTASTDDPYKYESEEGNYLNAFSTKVATADKLSDAKYIWNVGSNNNEAVIGSLSGSDIKFSFSDYIVTRIVFNVLTFKFSVEGIKLAVKVNGTQLMASGDFLYGQINFTKGQTISIDGLDDLASAYNRDFFEYDSASKTCKFIGDTGSWDVYYNYKYNYFWINRMSDVAPTAYWIIGSGFTSMPRWADDYPADWNLDDAKEVAYLKKVDSNIYQAHVYLSDSFDMQIFSNRTWNAQYAVFSDDRFSGDKTGFKSAGKIMADIVNSDGFTPGYYCITFDISAGLDHAAVKYQRMTN